MRSLIHSKTPRGGGGVRGLGRKWEGREVKHANFNARPNATNRVGHGKVDSLWVLRTQWQRILLLTT